MIHDYKLRPYHNPEGVDESKVPKGWRFRYADEMETKAMVAEFLGAHGWYRSCEYGRGKITTYIVPV